MSDKLLIGLGITAGAGPGEDGVREAQRAEELGFDFVSTSDHPVGDHPTYEAVALLTWILARTTRIVVASRVLGVPFRNPAVVAKTAASLQGLSGGRFVLGLGGGYADEEIARLGAGSLSPREKIDGLVDAVEIARGAWSRSRFTHAGRRYSVTDLTLEPKPDVAPPIWLGTYGPRALAATGRLADGWIPSLGFAPPARIPAMLDRIRTAAVEAGRDPGAVRAIYNVPVRIGPGGRSEPGVLTGTAGEVLEQLGELRSLGFGGFNVMPTGPDPDRQVRAFADEVLPALRGGPA
jgi:alkanesulfonate monooxygenase SsuD/methylene tetrahydromethanopterin reductase-like flavin-dependent oxidoreductase (luciferase family)